MYTLYFCGMVELVPNIFLVVQFDDIRPRGAQLFVQVLHRRRHER